MKKVISIIIATAVAVSSLGAWDLIDNFNSYSDGEIFTEATEIGWNASTEAGTDEYWFLADPWDAENTSLYVESGPLVRSSYHADEQSDQFSRVDALQAG